ncbi:MAG: hypothetical protein HZA46_02875 [Planctomycetales bacterium]|nr:hypothetical protein [Planctomycetales bacterium]
MFVTCSHCPQQDDVSPTKLSALRRFRACDGCGRCLTRIDVSDFSGWIDEQVRIKRSLQERGWLGSRKQSVKQSDADIDRDGLAAELAACLLLAPAWVTKWQRLAEAGVSNRGRDLLPRWTGLDKPVEVKQTRYRDDRRGFLLVRPPRWTPGEMKPEYLDDAYYVLLHSGSGNGSTSVYDLTLSGWTDRDGLLHDGVRNPVPVGNGQRECWGIHWSKLRPLDELAQRPASVWSRVIEFLTTKTQRRENR